MRHLGKLTAVAVAALALISPAAAQADPSTNYHQASDGYVELIGKTTCSWTNVPTNANPPATVTVPADAVTSATTCTNSYWCVVNEDFVVTFNGNPPTTATIAVVDFTCGSGFLWCRYRATNVVLTGGPATFTGYVEIPLYGTNYPGACPDPASGYVSVTF